MDFHEIAKVNKEVYGRLSVQHRVHLEHVARNRFRSKRKLLGTLMNLAENFIKLSFKIIPNTFITKNPYYRLNIDLVL